MSFANVAAWDRAARIVVGIALLAVGALGVVGGAAAVACKLFGWVPLLTGLLGWSPLYALLGISTLRRRRR